jgi:SAM-dependent methyltransferase
LNSFRREYLDQFLNQYKPLMKGRVLDVGGKKVNKRGSFVPPLENVESWEYLNSDVTTKPDYCCSAEEILLENETIDTVIMTEVLEYLPDPRKVFGEIHKILSAKGHALISVPFLNPLHGDHWADRARYTPVMLNELFKPVGLKVESIEPMGSVGAVIFDILRVSFGYAGTKGKWQILVRLLSLFRPLFRLIDKISLKQSKYINTGYFLILIKDT